MKLAKKARGLLSAVREGSSLRDRSSRERPNKQHPVSLCRARDEQRDALA